MNWIRYILEFCTESGVFDKDRLTGNYKMYINSFLEGDYNSRDRAFEGLDVALEVV